MKRSGKWAVVRKEAPKMPWENDPTATIFPRLQAQFGSAFALKYWKLLGEFVAILDACPDDDDAAYNIREFFNEIAAEHDDETLSMFRVVLKHVRIVAGGMERRRVARTALKKQKARLVMR